MKYPPFGAALFCVLLLSFFGAASADDGHDHGAPAASATSASSALPRFTAVSRTFELVGVLNGKQLVLYLDRFADNSPVKDAQLQLAIDGAKVETEPHGDGEFEAVLAAVPQAGVRAISATVVAGNQSELLAGEFDIHEEDHADAASARPRWQRIALWALGGLLALGVLAWIARRSMAARHAHIGGAA
ncbi:MAG: hypothetical protein EOO26_01390 [Comamonadaceae bacterium]|nr:MAG: hypothetical protein EOO26_01390 [Comamonadaceae bacterium]